jgi:ketosteroid isomerase-like protein
MSDDTNQRCVRSFIGAYYSGDAAAAAACCADDFDSVTYAPIELFPHLGHKRGKAWVGEAIAIQTARYAARKHDIVFMAAEGPRVATMTRAALTKRSDGRVVQMDVAEFFTLAGGRIVQHRSFFDSFDFVQQVLGRDLTVDFAASVRSAMRT